MNQNRNLTETIYETLRTDILELTIKPGEKVSEVQLGKRFNVSRAPIRDAVSKLQKEGLVLIKPQVGTIIMPISLKKAKDILQIRLLLEPYAAKIAAQHITDEDQEMLKNQFEKTANIKNASEKKKQRLYETDQILHNIIWERSGNEEIKNILYIYLGEIQRIGRSTAELANRVMPSENEIREIYEALATKNGSRARDAMISHLSNILSAVKSIYLDKNENRGSQ